MSTGRVVSIWRQGADGTIVQLSGLQRDPQGKHAPKDQPTPKENMPPRTNRKPPRQPRVVTAPAPLPADAIRQLGTAPDPVIGARYQVSTYRIASEREHLGVPAYQRASGGDTVRDVPREPQDLRGTLRHGGGGGRNAAATANHRKRSVDPYGRLLIMWLLLGGLITLGVLLATRHSSRESPPQLTYNVHGYWAARGYVVDSSFTEEGSVSDSVSDSVGANVNDSVGASRSKDLNQWHLYNGGHSPPLCCPRARQAS